MTAPLPDPPQLLIIIGGGSDQGAGRSGLIQLMKALRMLRLLKLARQYDGSVVIIRSLKVSMNALKVSPAFERSRVTGKETANLLSPPRNHRASIAC